MPRQFSPTAKIGTGHNWLVPQDPIPITGSQRKVTQARGNDRQVGISAATRGLIWQSHLGTDILSNAAVKHSEQVCFHLGALKQTGCLQVYLIRSIYESTSRGAESPQPPLIQTLVIRAG